MPDTPTPKPTTQAMKLGEQLVIGIAALFGLDEAAVAGIQAKRAELATAIDSNLGLPAMLKNVDDAEAVASDLFTVQELIGGKLRRRNGMDTWFENGVEHVRLGVGTVTIDVADDVTALFPEVKGSTKQFPWKARLIASHWLAKSGEYELVYEMTENRP